MSDPQIYTVGWICALDTELVAARAFLDETHNLPEGAARDNNTYTVGRIGKHNVVIAVLPAGEYGTQSAATVASHMVRTFKNVRIGLMVGIGGGAPTKHDIRLGDVVVGIPKDGRSGVFQFDFGKTLQTGKFQVTRHLDQPPMILRTAVSSLKAAHESNGHRLLDGVENALQRIHRRKKYKRPLPANDRLFKPDAVHTPESAGGCEACESNGATLEAREDRDPEEYDDPAIHYGLIASSNQLVRDAHLRDRLARDEGVLCFEIEAAGLMNHFPCLVIRGIYDYADSHKNKEWQGFAAMIAAAYAKELLLQIAADKVEQETRAHEKLNELHADLNARFDRVEERLETINPVDDQTTALKPHHILHFDDDPHFVHRPDIWEWMTSRYSADGHVGMALVGIGGIGKSQLAIRFGNEVQRHHPNTSVFWVRASTKATFKESCRQIADVLKVPRRNDAKQNVLALLCKWLQREDVTPWLMIIDNADDPKTMFTQDGDGTQDHRPISSCLPRTRNGKILVTSRSQDVAARLVGPDGILNVQEMEKSKALQLFQTKLSQDYNEDDCLSLIKALGNIPLAVTQAAAYIRMQSGRVTVQSYLRQFQQGEKERLRLLAIDKGDTRRYDESSNSVTVTWQVTFNQIRLESPEAADLLCLLSMFQPQNIPEFMLNGDIGTGSDQGEEDPQEIQLESIDVLHSYSLVSFPQPGFYDMHPLVQLCTRIWMSEFGHDSRWRRYFLKLAIRHFPSGEFETWEKCRVLLPHVQPLADTEPSEQKDLSGWAELLGNLSYYLQMLGEYARAETLAQAASSTMTELLGPHHPKTLSTMGKLASIYFSQGRWNEAEELQIEQVEAFKAKLGPDHHNTVISMYNLALTYSDQGRWDEAKDLQVEVAKALKTKLGPDHPDTLTSMHSLAMSYHYLGRLAEAEQLLVEVVEGRKTKLGPDHRDTLISVASLGSTYSIQGSWDEAEKLELAVMAANLTNLGLDYPDTLRVMANLGLTYSRQGRWDKAEELETEVVEAQKRKLGPNHPDTLNSMAHLVSIYWHQGRWDKAEELGTEALKARKTKLGHDHPKTLTSMNDLAWTWNRMGKSSEAVSLMRTCMHLLELKLGPNHPQTQKSAAALEDWTRGLDCTGSMSEESHQDAV